MIGGNKSRKFLPVPELFVSSPLQDKDGCCQIPILPMSELPYTEKKNK